MHFYTEEWWERKEETLPTEEEMINVWEVTTLNPPDGFAEAKEEQLDLTEEQQEYSDKLDLLLWYLDVWMPMVAGLENWGPTIRPFFFMTSTRRLDGDNSGKEKVLVTVTSEAFGLLVFANCREKWLADFEYKKGKIGKEARKVPKYNKDDPTTWKHQNKWSCGRTGSKIGAGWDSAAIEYFHKRIDDVKKQRVEQEKTGYAGYLEGQNLIKLANKIALDAPASAGKKRKRNPIEEPGKVEEEIVINLLDE